MIINQSDHEFGNGIYASHHAMYDRQWKDITRQRIALLKRALPIFRKHLNIPTDVRVRVAMIKNRNKRRIHGQYWHHQKVAEINPRQHSVQVFMATVAHELVHAEQYHEGRLIRDSNTVAYWNQQAVPYDPHNKVQSAYMNLPWEKEAFERQEELAVIVMRELGLIV